jgi:23S rRNA-/tRNA-specific pseudouridylate synthase
LQITISVLYSDDALVAVDKPAGLNVHEAPGPGSCVLRELQAQHGLDGLIPAHRLDKNASGVLLLARSKTVVAQLQRDWPATEKSYYALCAGCPPSDDGTLDAPILENRSGKPERLESALKYFRATHPGEEIPPLPPLKTSAVHPAGRSSQTEYHVIERFESNTGRWAWLEVRPKQGRMHQIRVHLAHAGCPLAFDPLYGKKDATEVIFDGRSGRVVLDRLPLHAFRLAFPHPSHGKQIVVEAPVPDLLAQILDSLRGGRLQ